LDQLFLAFAPGQDATENMLLEMFPDYFAGLIWDGKLIQHDGLEEWYNKRYGSFQTTEAGRVEVGDVEGVAVAQAGSAARVAVTGAGKNGVFRHAGAEAALAKGWSVQSLNGIATDANQMMSDIHADAAYRAHLVGVMARRAVASAG
jgi:carbon-monoxide dehydrogenase medium subunit